MSNLFVWRYVLEALHGRVLDTHMADSFEKIGDLIREKREARGWSQDVLAERVGTSQQNIGRIETGKVKHSRYIDPILRVLGSDISRAVSQTAEPGEVIPQDLLVGEKGMPLYAQAEGGDGAIIINFDPIDYLKWPAPLINIREGFGVLVTEESMFPAFEPGDIALVNPRLPPRRGKNCVLLGPESSMKVRALIKRYQSQSDGIWRVSQWNPAEDFSLAKAEWPRCYSVVGKYDAR
ncbi:XRE family transcriptional regulator [Devosia pacifica]|uniref:XRE family transcriptional regulator n=1 Tax=Devosia pacifica TaxID=1335967 RepID=UPI001677C62D|nr:helix-turn-helix domain-containing protein [Devosia pacifica]